MKHYYLLAAAALMLASCSSDDVLDGSSPEQKASSNEIVFSSVTPNMTRANLTGSDAATKLNNEFVVLGWKSNGWTDGATDAAGSYTNGVNKVFDNYTVHYDGNAGSTESNKKGWEYVGYKSQPVGKEGVDQSIKYWDYSYSQYDFIAWSLTGSAKLESITEDAKNPYKIHALTFTAPTAADLAYVYVSNQKTVKEAAYKNTVELTFRNMASKVRIGIYETVPGYSVKDVKFYTALTTKGDATPYLFVKTGTPFAKAGTVTAKYRDAQDATTENDVVVSTAASETDSKVQFGTFTPAKAAEYKESSSDNYLGRTSNEATMSNGGEWTPEFPMEATEMVLKVNYTLVSTDGSGETITVTGAKATVPANYGEWKANYAYTYLFKISDNTNGSTGGDDPDGDGPHDPAGLYPITFDACVVAVEDGNTQETITEVATPSITTYQNGSKITSDNEYQASTTKHIFVTADGIDLTITNTKLYTAIDLGKDKEGITEKTVANYANNDIILSDASALLTNVADNKIPATETIDGVAISLSKSAVQFYPSANTTYVVEIINGSDKYYKVIKVENTASASATYTLAVKSGSETTIAEGGSTIITVVDAKGYKVTGAKNYFDGASDFTVSETTEGEYTFTAKAGTTTGAKSIKLNGSTALDITVNAYEFANSNVDVIEGATAEITLNLGSGAATDVDAATNFSIDGTGLSISSVSDGKVTIAAAAGAKSGKITYTNNVEVASATVTVKSYALAASPTIINKGEKSTLTLTCGGAATTGVVALTSSNITAIASTTATTTGNTVEVTGLAKGTATFSNTNFASTATVEVVDFAVTLYSDAACTTAYTGDLSVATGTYYAKFTDADAPTNATGLTAQGCSIAKMSDTGVYKVTVTATGTATITYNYSGKTFILVSKTVGA